MKTESGSGIGLASALFYAGPKVYSTLLVAPIILLQGIYATYFNFGMSEIALMFLFLRTIDAVSDPLIGFFLDRFFKNGTSRRLVIVSGLFILVTASILLYSKGANITIVEVGAFVFFMQLGSSLFDIAHSSWPREIYSDPRGREGLYTYRTIAHYLGLSLFYCLPLTPFFDVSDITPDTLIFLSQISAMLYVPLACYIFFGGSRIGTSHDIQEKPNKNSCHDASPAELLRDIRGNKSFLWFLLASVLFGFGSSMWYGMLFVYIDSYLGQGSAFSKIFLVSFFVGIAISPVWRFTISKLGKALSWALASLMLIISILLTLYSTPLNVTIFSLLALKIISSVCYSGMNTIRPLWLAELAELNAVKRSKVYGYSYFAIDNFMGKLIAGSGYSIGFLIAGYGGFSPSSEVHNAISIFWLNVATCWIPLTGIIMSSLVIFLCFPNWLRSGSKVYWQKSLS